MFGQAGSPRRSFRSATATVAAFAAIAVFILSTSVATASATGDPQASTPPAVLVVGHRGASTQAPEHTGPAYDRAVWAGADVVECDLQLTADEQLVCIHDANVDRTTGGSVTGSVDSFTLAELREMDFGSWFGPEFAGARVVTLEEQITCYRAVDPTIRYYVETKTQPDQGDTMETELVELLNRLDVVPEFPGGVRSSPVIIQSFDVESLNTIRTLAPELPTAYLFSVATPEIEAGQFPDVDVLAPNAAVIAARPDLVDTAHAAGLEVHTWTVDDPAQMTALVDTGVDGFFTNDPATGRTIVDQAGRGSGREPIDVGDPAPTGPSDVAACAEGMGVGLSASPIEAPPIDEASDTGNTGDTGAPAAEESTPLWPVVVGVVILVGAGLAVAIGRLRRSRKNSP